MMDKFTKADLKEGMVLTLDDKNVATLVNCFYITKNDIEFVNGKLFTTQSCKKITKIEYGGNVIWEAQVNRMTAEEMRKKLEELTGENIEVEPTREEMIGMCYEFCRKQDCSKSCILHRFGNCCFKSYSDKKLKQCYEKVMEDGRKKQSS